MIPSTAVRQPSTSFIVPAIPSRLPEEAFADQVAAFLERHKGGFEGRRWTRDQRGQGAKRRLKRHRDPAIVDAQALAARLPDVRARSAHREALTGLQDVLRQTSLVPIGQVRRLRHLSIEPAAERALAEALADLRDASGLEAWTRALDQVTRPSWELVTAPLALAQPQTHVWVRPKLLGLQAERLGRALVVSSRPTLEGYRSYQALLADVRTRLERSGLKPRDLLDVCDFVWATLRPLTRATLPGAHRRRTRAARSGEAA